MAKAFTVISVCLRGDVSRHNPVPRSQMDLPNNDYHHAFAAQDVIIPLYKKPCIREPLAPPNLIGIWPGI
jgi:hypothetical protein